MKLLLMIIVPIIRTNGNLHLEYNSGEECFAQASIFGSNATDQRLLPQLCSLIKPLQELLLCNDCWIGADWWVRTFSNMFSLECEYASFFSDVFHPHLRFYIVWISNFFFNKLLVVTQGFLHLIVFPDILPLKLKLQIFVANVNIGPTQQAFHCSSSPDSEYMGLPSTRTDDHKNKEGLRK